MLPIEYELMNDDYGTLAENVLSGWYAGKVMLVAWHHGRIPQLAEALGVKPPYKPWPDAQFDRVWKIEWRDGNAVLTDLLQELLVGDSK
jgi:hypothetical protein